MPPASSHRLVPVGHREPALGGKREHRRAVWLHAAADEHPSRQPLGAQLGDGGDSLRPALVRAEAADLEGEARLSPPPHGSRVLPSRPPERAHLSGIPLGITTGLTSYGHIRCFMYLLTVVIEATNSSTGQSIASKPKRLLAFQSSTALWRRPRTCRRSLNALQNHAVCHSSQSTAVMRPASAAGRMMLSMSASGQRRGEIANLRELPLVYAVAIAVADLLSPAHELHALVELGCRACRDRRRRRAWCESRARQRRGRARERARRGRRPGCTGRVPRRTP